MTNDTIKNIALQTIGDSIIYDGIGASIFSPDGSLYSNVDNLKDLNIFRFDRCTGLFYDSTYIQVPNPTPSTYDNRTVGMAFSANSRFLYVILYTRIIQYDMQAANIAASQTYVAEWDTFSNPFYTRFLSAQLAPDNKIYIGTSASCYNLHYIDEPDSAGLACDVIQNTFAISSTNHTVPTYPNYDLGRWVGSPCDTLVGVNENEQDNYPIKVFPNPASDFITINYKILPNETAQFVLYNTMGEIVNKKNLFGSFKSLLVHTNNLRNGVYSWSVFFKNRKTQSGKLVVIR